MQDEARHLKHRLVRQAAKPIRQADGDKRLQTGTATGQEHGRTVPGMVIGDLIQGTGSHRDGNGEVMIRGVAGKSPARENHRPTEQSRNRRRTTGETKPRDGLRRQRLARKRLLPTPGWLMREGRPSKRKAEARPAGSPRWERTISLSSMGRRR